ncbi:MAG: hypothetical protein U1D69_10125, partial [Polynucleobacter sp.]|nr:hypothetical protein [Polynucleobacter sp.]
ESRQSDDIFIMERRELERDLVDLRGGANAEDVGPTTRVDRSHQRIGANLPKVPSGLSSLRC